MKKRIYISGKITNEPNYEENFAKAEEYLESIGYKAINPAKVKVANLSYDEFMKIDLCLLEMADGIYMLRDWMQSNGAKIEFLYAVRNRKHILLEQ